MYILGIHLDPPFLHKALIRKTRQGIEIVWLKSDPVPENLQQEDPSDKCKAAIQYPKNPHPNDDASLRTPGKGAFLGTPQINVKRQYNTPKTEALFGDPRVNVKRLYITSGLSPKDFLIRSMELKIASHI